MQVITASLVAACLAGAVVEAVDADRGDNRVNAIIEGCQLDVWPSAVYAGGVASVRIRSQEGPPEGEDGWYWRIDVTRGLDGQDVAQTL